LSPGGLDIAVSLPRGLAEAIISSTPARGKRREVTVPLIPSFSSSQVRLFLPEVSGTMLSRWVEWKMPGGMESAMKHRMSAPWAPLWLWASLMVWLVAPVTGANDHGQAVQEKSGAVAIKPVPPVMYVGQIFIIGNETLPQNIVLELVPFFPGQRITSADLKVVERNLERLGLFVIDPAKGVRPCVTILDPKGKVIFKDVLIEVQERPGAWLACQAKQVIHALAIWRTCGVPPADLVICIGQWADYIEDLWARGCRAKQTLLAP
jgi:hypothetical protein